MTDEGYIKYQAHWDQKTIEVPEAILSEINRFRTQLIALGMMGKIPDGPSFGNISVREQESRFYISGSDTGMLPRLEAKHLARVLTCEESKNELWFEGPITASSESMTHAAVYKQHKIIRGVIHIHHAALWKSSRNVLPTTPGNISYGTPEMALALASLIQENPDQKILVLGGHPEGMLSYGHNLEEAYTALINWYKRM